MQLQRDLRRHIGDARGERADADRVVGRHQVVARAADPTKSIADVSLDDLEAPDVALTVLPRDQRRNRRQPLDHRRARMEPVAAVNEQAERRRFANRRVVFQQTVVFRAGVVRRERQDSGGAGRGRLAGQLAAERHAESRSRDDGKFPARLFDDGADDVEVFAGRERVELAGPAGSHNRRQWMLEHHPDVLPERVQIDREIGRNGVIGKPMTPVSASRRALGDRGMGQNNSPESLIPSHSS